ncbi:N-acetylated-alpha-linked acidic dipeptidase [Neolewinella xylanilytica]|uniref:N-acetylated-alpha-linked acidic dipeptidase n=1 Tax=Neolewinella xylanilytica TaxID=1514080 RepID=A0A2S6I2Q1_9BACT|nr:transferrin receptor-like dimerization domain-containing protein [Neolewinella xylanilytica]PPK85445.1 N-acetylated-alpha-linked acidic dipeptidase [Neolewinella xylanilytica]
MKTVLSTCLPLLFGACLLGQSPAPLMGFTEASAAKQRALESQFDTKVKPGNLDEWMQYMTAQPHHVGSPYDKQVVDFLAEKFRSWGYEVQVERFDVLFPTPKVRKLELLEPTPYTAMLQEPPVEGDAATEQTEAALPPYNAFSIDGDVTAELIFVNYGVPADYEELERRGIDVAGKIVIAKYQGSWRGIKPKVAAEKGAIGCILYSDPEDDGYYQGATYPDGAYKNEYGVQRGAVMDLPRAPGDPLTPGYGATKDAERLDISEAEGLTEIPVLPISYHDALPLLKALGGPVAPGSWRGALPITYHIGPGPAKVHLGLEFNWELAPAYDVIATLEGEQYPDEWVIRGNHHDAWVHGANDPISGMVAVMEEARAVGELAKAGMRPKRTIKYAAWGAEEPGLLGSTEWVETHADELREKAVAYINTDASGRGFLNAGGSHTLEKFFGQITKDVEDPQTGVSVFERRKAAEATEGKDITDFPLSALGSGSDYSPFFQHLGIAAFNMGFGGESSGGEYHTMYDSYDHYKRFKDPDFSYGGALVKVAGRTTLRLANADVLPFEFTRMAETLKAYGAEVTKLADDIRERTARENRLIRENAYELAADPKEAFSAPKPKEEVPYLNFAPLQNGLTRIGGLAGDYSADAATQQPDAQRERLNNLFMDLERQLTREEGLPRRPWFVHHVYAPGFYTGYGVKTFPGVREAIEQRNFGEAQEQIDKLGAVLSTYADQMKRIIGIVATK